MRPLTTLACALAALAPAPQSEEGFVPLFNGKDLGGWRYGKDALDGKTETADRRFGVEDGVIVAREKDADGKGGIKDLTTVQEFDRDFQLKLEFRAGPKADSGVYIRGPQLQVRDFLRRGEQKQLAKFRNDDWNELDITVRAKVATASVNGRSLTDQDALELTFKDGKPAAKLNGEPVDVANVQVGVGTVARCLVNGELLAADMKVGAKGPIGLQAESGKFEFRNVRIRMLP